MAAPVRFLNSLTKKKEPFVPRKNDGTVTFYTCGPTVYNFLHLGNLRAAFTADIIFRVLKKAGYAVNFIRNYTDIDDKIIAKAHADQVSVETITQKFITEAELDYQVAGLLPPTKTVKVTEHVGPIVGMIEAILQKGDAYVTKSGEVFFSVRSKADYGKLSGRKPDELREGARVEVNPDKKDPLDFALWKPAKPGEPSYPSPWGPGRPGWHIECSAMVKNEFGDQIDLHHGGSDLQFPHHENEIAQSESATGKIPYVKVWLHNGMLNLSDQKMSKSLGNIVLAREFLIQYGGEVARHFFLSSHYRSTSSLSDLALQQTVEQLTKIYEAKKEAMALLTQKKLGVEQVAESAWAEFCAELQEKENKFIEAMANDMNSPDALGQIFLVLKAFKQTLELPRARATPGALIGAEAFLKFLSETVYPIFGTCEKNPETRLLELKQLRDKLHHVPPVAERTAEQVAAIETQIAARNQARVDKDFARADEIRKALEAEGILLKDEKGKTVWSPK